MGGPISYRELSRSAATHFLVMQSHLTVRGKGASVFVQAACSTNILNVSRNLVFHFSYVVLRCIGTYIFLDVKVLTQS